MDLVSRVGATTFTTPSAREIVVTRAFDAPRALVFDAWTNPEHLPHWMGPREWTMTACEIDLRPGGAFRFAWDGPGGAQMGISGLYREIVPPERLVTTEAWAGWGETLNTLVFAEASGKTAMTCTVLFPSSEALSSALATPMRDGMSAGFDRLDARLRTMA